MRIFTEVLRKICIFKTSSDYSLLPSLKCASPLFLVLASFFKILVCINLKLTASRLVAGDYSVRMELKRAYGPRVVNTTLNTVTESASLVVSADKEHYLLGVANSTYANRKSGLRYFCGIISEEA